MHVDVKTAARLLGQMQDLLILCHQHPDGDTLGSAFALYYALGTLGIRARVLSPDPIPKRFDYLLTGYHPQQYTPQSIIAVDVADLQLLKQVEEGYKQHITLAIDHHESHKEYAQYTCLDAAAASTAEIVYEIITQLQVTFSRQIASCIYTGVSTDTGCFKFSNTTAYTHLVAAKCFQAGVDFAAINRSMFETKSKSRIVLERMLMDTLQFHFDDRCAMVYITRDMLATSGAQDDEIDSLSDLPRQIEGVDVGICLRELASGGFKVSMRSSQYINVSQVCAALGGGGHVRAAGCFLDTDLKTAQMMVVSVLKAYFERLDEAARKRR